MGFVSLVLVGGWAYACYQVAKIVQIASQQNIIP